MPTLLELHMGHQIFRHHTPATMNHSYQDHESWIGDGRAEIAKIFLCPALRKWEKYFNWGAAMSFMPCNFNAEYYFVNEWSLYGRGPLWVLFLFLFPAFNWFWSPVKASNLIMQHFCIKLNVIPLSSLFMSSWCSECGVCVIFIRPGLQDLLLRGNFKGLSAWVHKDMTVLCEALYLRGFHSPSSFHFHVFAKLPLCIDFAYKLKFPNAGCHGLCNWIRRAETSTRSWV